MPHMQNSLVAGDNLLGLFTSAVVTFRTFGYMYARSTHQYFGTCSSAFIALMRAFSRVLPSADAE